MSPGPQQRRLPVGFQQASLTFVFDLRLAIKLSAGVIIVLVRVVMVSADMPCRCCGLGGVFYIHTPVGLTPFPSQGFIPVSFLIAELRGLLLCLHTHRFSIAASLCKGLRLVCFVMLLCTEETLIDDLLLLDFKYFLTYEVDTI